ncbi:N-acetyltransferase 10, partial [Stegodyphus mimosarum]
MAILQDFEALTPNLLARTVETVEGGGMILILLQTLTSLKQLYTMAMDVHARYRTEAHQDIVCRFNERFILSLPTCSDCLVLDDKLNILPISSNALSIKPLPPKSLDGPKSLEEEELISLKSSVDSSQPVGVLVKLCKTLDQAKAVMKFIESLSEKTLRSTVTLTSARGRGKSAALGLAIAGAIAFKYTNIFVTSPHPENLKTLFKFLLEGLDALGYEKTTDYEETRSTNPEFNKAVVQVTVNRKHRQTVKYISPSSNLKIGLVELVVIDEAAAIPLPFVKSLLGPYLVFMASTINGYEGTGRSLSLKLINQLRKQSSNNQVQDDDLESSKNKLAKASLKRSSVTGRVLHEITLNESIRYRNGDKVEDWLNRLLCLDVTIHASKLLTPPPATECKLYYVNRDTLFSYNKFAERFLRKLVAIFVASHYKNSPNDLLIMSDAPAHHIFCLCAPSTKKLPEILCVVQICMEGKLSQNTVKQELNRGRRGAGDLIPWTISQEFSEEDFPALAGARIVRIATHPEYQRKGYGLHALKLLQEFYEGKNVSHSVAPVNMTPKIVENDAEITENVLEPRTSLPPLLFELNQLNPDILDYIGVSYGLSEDLFRFWKKAGFCAVYLGHTPNQLTGEHSCIMLKQLKGLTTKSKWLPSFWFDFCEKIIQCLPYPKLADSLALDLVSNDIFNNERPAGISKAELFAYLRPPDCDLLKKFSDDMNFGIPPNYITAVLAQFYFTHRIRECHLNKCETISLFSIGILHRSYEEVAIDLNLTIKQVKENFGSAIKKVADCILHLCEEE